MAGLVVAAILGAATPAAAQSISPLEFGPMLVWDGFNFQIRMGWKATWSAPLAQQFFAVDASWPRPPIGLTDEQRCGHQPYTNGGLVSVDILPPAPPGSYSVTITLKQCLFTNGAYQITPIATASGWGVIEADGTFSGGSGTTPPPQLKILPQTTRWRPQRDLTAPITVRFRGPGSLDASTVRLEVTAPAGVSSYSATIGAVTPVDGTTDQFTVPWTGPWSTPNANGGQDPLPSGNYRLVLRGRPAGAAEDLVSDAYEKVSLVEVVAVEIQPYDGSVLDPNPGAAGVAAVGDRVFAEAMEPLSQSNPTPIVFDTVRLVARFSPAVDLVQGQDPVKVQFRAIDVDDPSATGKPIDDEARTADNRADTSAGLFGPTYPANGAPADAAVNAVLEQSAFSGSDEASAVLRVSPRQGDNYRFLASTSRKWVEDALAKQGAPASGSLPAWVVDPQGTALDSALEGKQVSKLLTVWRTLHIEMDRLVSTATGTDQAAMDLQGTFTNLRARTLTDATGSFQQKVPPANHWVAHNKSDGWQGGELRVGFHGSDLYDVSGNSAKDIDVTVASGQPTLLAGLTTAQALQQADKSYIVQDDHVGALAAMSADPSLAEQLLAKAYVRVTVHGAADQPADIPFAITPYTTTGQGTLDTRNMRDDALYGLPSEGRSTPSYWSIQLVSAFEGDPAKDMDPQVEGNANLGGTQIGSCVDGGTKIGGCKPHAAVYLEVARDLVNKPQGFPNLPPLVDIIRRSTAHELFHGLGLTHGKAIMCGGVMLDAGSQDGGRLTDDHVLALRGVKKPTVSQSKKATCR
jgi:hypothetical protein